MSIESAESAIDKQFGEGSIFKLGSRKSLTVDVIPTGCLDMDEAIGPGGFPSGRIVEIYGPESSGKTTLALHVAANVQKMINPATKRPWVAAIVDVEHALDPAYAKKIGVNTDELRVSQPDYGEQALEITEHLVRSGEVGVLIVDSVAALVPKSELEGNMGDAQMGIHARLMSQAMRKLTGSVHNSNCCLIFINQLRSKIGVVFGSPETTTGGNALKFYSSLRIDIRRKESIKRGDEVVGARTRVKMAKNKLGPPHRTAEFDLLYDRGISREGDLIDVGVRMGVVEKAGAWYSLRGERIGQGRDKAVLHLCDNSELSDRLESELRGMMWPKK